jgi:hypothetical protein
VLNADYSGRMGDRLPASFGLAVYSLPQRSIQALPQIFRILQADGDSD